MDVVEIFLDVETDWNRDLTALGFRSSATGLIQLVGEEITRSRVVKELPRSGKLYTYNGHCFDLNCIRRQLRLDLREWFESWDLRWICQRHGICGEQKAIEKRIGICRTTDGINGIEAMYLWERFKRGDKNALGTLLRYNSDDLDGIEAIRHHLDRSGLLIR